MRVCVVNDGALIVKPTTLRHAHAIHRAPYQPLTERRPRLSRPAFYFSPKRVSRGYDRRRRVAK